MLSVNLLSCVKKIVCWWQTCQFWSSRANASRVARSCAQVPLKYVRSLLHAHESFSNNLITNIHKSTMLEVILQVSCSAASVLSSTPQQIPILLLGWFLSMNLSSLHHVTASLLVSPLHSWGLAGRHSKPKEKIYVLTKFAIDINPPLQYMLSLCQHIWKFHPGRARLSVQPKWGELPSHATSSYKDTKSKTRGEKNTIWSNKKRESNGLWAPPAQCVFFFLGLTSIEKSMSRHS